MRVREMLAPGVATIEADSALDARLRAEVLQFLGDMDRMVAPELAQLPLEKALELRREIHGPRHELVGSSLFSLGILALNHRDWQDAGVGSRRAFPSSASTLPRNFLPRSPGSATRAERSAVWTKPRRWSARRCPS